MVREHTVCLLFFFTILFLSCLSLSNEMKTYFKGNHLKHFYCFLPDNSISPVFQITRLLHHSFTPVVPRKLRWERRRHGEEQVEHELDPWIDTLNGRSFTNLTSLTRHWGSNWPSQLDHWPSFSSYYNYHYLNPFPSFLFAAITSLDCSSFTCYTSRTVRTAAKHERSRITFMTREKKRRAWLFTPLSFFLLIFSLLRTVIGNGSQLYKFLSREFYRQFMILK